MSRRQQSWPARLERVAHVAIISCKNGRDLGSGMIHRRTLSRTQHTALCFWEEGRFEQGLVIEALFGKGVIVRPLAHEDTDLSNREWHMLLDESALDAQAAHDFAHAQAGKPYDEGNLIWGFALGFNLSRQEIQEERKNRQRWHCSELVFCVFVKGGVRLLRYREGWETAPIDIISSPLLRTIGLYELAQLRMARHMPMAPEWRGGV